MSLAGPSLKEEAEGSERARWRGGRWTPFVVVAGLTVGACLAGGFFGPPGRSPLVLSRLSAWLGVEVALPSGWFIVLFWAIWALGLAGVLLVPRGLSKRTSARIILALAIASRVALLPHPPSDDVNRYLWEGRVLAAGFSPYSHPPVALDDPEVDHLRDPGDPVWRGINHPTMSAIYPPFVLSIFALLAPISAGPLAVKVVMVCFDVGAVLLLLGILRRLRIEDRWVLIHAQSPVVLFAFAGEGHLDAVHVFFLIAALSLFQQRRLGWTWVALGLAFQAKYVAALAWPFFAASPRRGGPPASGSWRWIGLGLAVAAAPLVLFFVADGPAVVTSLRAFGTEMAFNGSIHAVLSALVGDSRVAAAVSLALLGLVVLHGLWRFRSWSGSGDLQPRADVIGGLFLVFGAALLCSPTVHFWYLTWVLPFVALRPTVSWLVLSATIALTFVTWGVQHQTGIWAFPWWGPWAVWTVPLLLMIRDLRRHVSRGRVAAPVSDPVSVSVVVPTRDEADRIVPCLEAVMTDPAVLEVIVVDGGSSDATADLAGAAGARVVVHSAPYDRGGGRGGQIRVGVAAAAGDVVAVVHADTRVVPGTFTRVLERLQRNPDVVGGAVGAVFDGAGLALRVLEVANDFRAAFLGISFGDQVQFFRRAAVADRGLVPDIPLMEDVELSLRLARLGRVCFLWGEALVSPRRWQRGAHLRVRLVLGLVTEYLVHRWFGTPDTAEMYRRYYHRNRQDANRS